MSHDIDFSKGFAAIAYANGSAKPWHGLGSTVEPGQGIEVWRKAAGLDFEVKKASVFYNVDGEDDYSLYGDKNVLYRDDTGAPLSVVSSDYREVQPNEILDFFSRLSEIGGFEMETAGSLKGGRKIWALAKINDGAPIIGQDVVRPYLLLATSYDGTLATIGKLVAERVVCANTLSMAVSEAGSEGKAVSSTVRIPHSTDFKPDQVRRDLGIAADIWDKWKIETKLLAERGMDEKEADAFVYTLVSGSLNTDIKDIRKNRTYVRIMDLYNSNASGLIGNDLVKDKTRWRMVNAVTQVIDHEKGRTNSARLDSAWFGLGDKFKSKAYTMLTNDASFKLAA